MSMLPSDAHRRLERKPGMSLAHEASYGPPKIKRSELSNLRMVAGNENKYDKVIIDGVVKQWVGIGWVDEGKPTPKQLKTLPIVED